MKCFHHENRDAAATCQHCGKALCKECAAKYTPCLCDDCYAALVQENARQQQAAQEQQRQRRRSALAETRSDFIKTCLFGLILVGIACAVDFWGGGEIKNALTVAPLLFPIPFGWRLASHWQDRLTVSIAAATGHWAVAAGFLVGKILVCMIIGVPAFFYQLYRTIKAQSSLRSMQQQTA